MHSAIIPRKLTCNYMGKYMTNSSELINWYKFKSNSWTEIQSNIVTEKGVTLSVNGFAWLEFLCTPIDLIPMAVGFLYNEDIIESNEEIASIHVCESNEIIDVWLNKSVTKPDFWRRTSGCTGGFTNINSVNSQEIKNNPIINIGACLTPAQITKQMAILISAQKVYRETGGVHTSALSDGEKIYFITEDIGRHNTLDKIAGFCLINKISIRQRIILTTGRISSEMMQKSAKIGAIAIISRTSPSSLSVKLAEQWGITLIGYARKNTFNIYTHPERILIPMLENK